MGTMIVVLFALSYAMWGISFASFGKQWIPENNAVIAADVLFSSGIIMAFFHLTHIFQVRAQIKGVCLLSFNSDGDLQLEKHPVSRENKTNCFPRDHTLSVQVLLGFYKNILESLDAWPLIPTKINGSFFQNNYMIIRTNGLVKNVVCLSNFIIFY